MADLTNDIAQQAVEPISVTADGQSTTGRSVNEMLAAKNALDAAVAVKRRRRGLLFTQLVTPGPVDDCGRAATQNFDGGLG